MAPDLKHIKAGRAMAKFQEYRGMPQSELVTDLHRLITVHQLSFREILRHSPADAEIALLVSRALNLGTLSAPQGSTMGI
jgi:hypothetical protein